MLTGTFQLETPVMNFTLLTRMLRLVSYSLQYVLALFILSSAPFPSFPVSLNCCFFLCFIIYRSAGSACTAVCQEIKYLYSMYICSEHGVKVKICWLVHFYQLQLWGYVSLNYYCSYKWKVNLIQYQNAAVHFKLCWERSECKGESNILVSTSLISSFSYITINNEKLYSTVMKIK